MIQGHPSIVPIEGYQISDVDTAGPYYGYLNPTGEWYIMKETVDGTVTSYTFVKGSSDYIINWGKRATTLIYQLFSEVF